MTRISNRLKAVTIFLKKEDNVVDVGCDHGLLSLYLEEHNLVKNVIASDINQNALNNAIQNIKKRNSNIKTYLSDGIDSVPLKGINTIIISGMGTRTILHILRDDKKLKSINKIIIQSNNDYEILRREMNNKGYYLEKEEYTYDKKIWYVTSCFIKSDKKNSLEEIQYGFLDNTDYNKHLLEKEISIYKKIPFTSFINKAKAYLKYLKIKKTISSK